MLEQSPTQCHRYLRRGRVHSPKLELCCDLSVTLTGPVLCHNHLKRGIWHNAEGKVVGLSRQHRKVLLRGGLLQRRVCQRLNQMHNNGAWRIDLTRTQACSLFTTVHPCHGHINPFRPTRYAHEAANTAFAAEKYSDQTTLAAPRMMVETQRTGA